MRIVALGSIVALAMSGQALAAGKGYDARFVAPVEKTRVIVRDLIWQCDDRHCTAAAQSDSRPVIVCMALARELGPVLDFATADKALDAADLARCNAPRNGKASVSSR